MFLEELVEQHRVHLFVAHAVDFAVLVTDYQVGVYLFYVFGHQSELLCASRINFLLITKRDRLEREERFAGFIHRFDVVLEPRGRRQRPEPAVRIYNNSHPSRRRRAEYVAYVAAVVHVITCEVRADTDNVTGCDNITAGASTQS